MMDGQSDSSLSSITSSLEIENALLAGSTVRFSSMGSAGPGGRRDRKERKRVKKGKGKYVSSDSEEDDEDDEMFNGKGRSWADNDEVYIRGLQVSLLSCSCFSRSTPELTLSPPLQGHS